MMGTEGFRNGAARKAGALDVTIIGESALRLPRHVRSELNREAGVASGHHSLKPFWAV
jgi:uncharacterized protein with HEPN domain